MASENTSRMVPTSLKSDEFDVAANIMILCMYVRIFAITSLLENNIYNQTDFKTHAAELSQSPLYRAKKSPSTKTRASQNQCLNNNYTLISQKFLKSNNNDMMGLVNDMDIRELQQILTWMVIDFHHPWDMLKEVSQDELLFNTWALWYKESHGVQH
ncbi:uncharacterized protein CIMG_12152 [Coccidioides immitis RS]|uniref:Uncharacterized protein n=1 Tax=Coccidioides immitis (strain RS) TaxID=246410 RepID=A0A0D8JTW4_COCIM|nr:uncharacterized protein CIMG_12152 [Coccidioides immitis RS]KJF60785.1 hypothetical protein CIMG_12152 [Coccidioides immitis RS]